MTAVDPVPVIHIDGDDESDDEGVQLTIMEDSVTNAPVRRCLIVLLQLL